jgi:hypothetical protein
MPRQGPQAEACETTHRLLLGIHDLKTRHRRALETNSASRKPVAALIPQVSAR